MKEKILQLLIYYFDEWGEQTGNWSDLQQDGTAGVDGELDLRDLAEKLAAGLL